MTRSLRMLFFGACVAIAAQAAAQESTWRVSVGGGLTYVPKFPGADHNRLIVLPVVGATYGRFFFGAVPGGATLGGVGFNFYQDPHWSFSAALSAGLAERRESDDPRLQGLGNVDRTASAGLAGGYRQDWWTLRGSVLTDILNRGQGTLVNLNALGRFRADEKLTFFGGPGLTWADARYTRTFFGVSEQQSAASGLPEFATHAGLNSVRLALGAAYRFDARWTATAYTGLSWLQGDAANSPITESRSQYFVGAAVFYRFGDAPSAQDPAGFIFGQ